MNQQYKSMDLPEAEQPVSKKYTAKLMKVFEERFAGDKMKDDYIIISTGTFTEDELRLTGITARTAGRRN